MMLSFQFSNYSSIGRFNESLKSIIHHIPVVLSRKQVQHKASTAYAIPSLPLTPNQVFPCCKVSSSTVLLQLYIGRPLLLLPWEFQTKAFLSIVFCGFLNVRAIDFHFLFFMHPTIGMP